MTAGWGLLAPLGITIALLYKAVWPGKRWFLVGLVVAELGMVAMRAYSFLYPDPLVHHARCPPVQHCGHCAHRAARQGTVALYTGRDQ